MSPLEPILRPITRERLKELAARRVIVVGGELHADEEQWLLDDGSSQADLWRINLYPADSSEDWIEFDSMTNVRPAQGNPSRGVDCRELAASLFHPREGGRQSTWLEGLAGSVGPRDTRVPL